MDLHYQPCYFWIDTPLNPETRPQAWLAVDVLCDKVLHYLQLLLKCFFCEIKILSLFFALNLIQDCIRLSALIRSLKFRVDFWVSGAVSKFNIFIALNGLLLLEVLFFSEAFSSRIVLLGISCAVIPAPTCASHNYNKLVFFLIHCSLWMFFML